MPVPVDRPYPVEKIVEKIVNVPVEKIVEKIVRVPVEVIKYVPAPTQKPSINEEELSLPIATQSPNAYLPPNKSYLPARA